VVLQQVQGVGVHVGCTEGNNKNVCFFVA
jgi:hypothetical protein